MGNKTGACREGRKAAAPDAGAAIFLDDTLEQAFKMEALFKKMNEEKGKEES